MTIWILEDLEDDIPNYEIIKEENLHKVYKQIGWRYTVYKCNDKDVIIPTEKNNIFKFKGYKCSLIENMHFNSNFIPCTVCLSEKDFKKFPLLKEKFEYVKNYEYFKDIVEYEEIETKSILGKKEKYYKFFINGFVIQPKKFETIIVSNYRIKSEYNIDNKEVL